MKTFDEINAANDAEMVANDRTFEIDYSDRIMVVTHKDGKDRVPLTEFWEEKEYPDIKMIWHSDYWDGPLSGMCSYKGTRYWFNCESMEHDSGVRTYALYALSDKEIEYFNTLA